VSAALEAAIGWRFKRPLLAEEALTHSSAAEGRKTSPPDNERLEFLGDRVLGLILAQRLFEIYPSAPESALALRLNSLVNRQACARAARRAGLGAFLVLSKSEEAAGGRDKETILADACEALIAALYLDGGFSAACTFVDRFWAPEWEAQADQPTRDAKTALQEWAAGRGKPNPAYLVHDRSGPDHAPVFIVDVHVGPEQSARGEGKSKRDAERAAAAALLAKLGIES
jgi:ribonuclease III